MPAPAPTPRAHTPHLHPQPAPAPMPHARTCLGTASAHGHALHCPHHLRAAARQTRLRTEQLVMQQHLPSKAQTWDFVGKAYWLVRGRLVYQLLIKKLKKKVARNLRKETQRRVKKAERLGAADTETEVGTQSWPHRRAHGPCTPHCSQHHPLPHKPDKLLCALFWTTNHTQPRHVSVPQVSEVLASTGPRRLRASDRERDPSCVSFTLQTGRPASYCWQPEVWWQGGCDGSLYPLLPSVLCRAFDAKRIWEPGRAKEMQL